MNNRNDFGDGFKKGSGMTAGTAVAGIGIAALAGFLVGGPAGALAAGKGALIILSGGVGQSA